MIQNIRNCSTYNVLSKPMYQTARTLEYWEIGISLTQFKLEEESHDDVPRRSKKSSDDALEKASREVKRLEISKTWTQLEGFQGQRNSQSLRRTKQVSNVFVPHGLGNEKKKDRELSKRKNRQHNHGGRDTMVAGFAKFSRNDLPG